MKTDFEERHQRRIERYEELAEKAEEEAKRRINSPYVQAVIDMGGEPIKVGHHSERRHRALLKRADRDVAKALEEWEKAKHYRQKADAAKKNRAIYSDDPNALEKLREKLRRLEEAHEEGKRLNKEYRRVKGNIDAMNIPDTLKEQFKKDKATWFMGPDNWRPYPSFAVQNTNAEIRRIKDRIAALEKAAKDETQEIPFDGGTIVINVEANRVQIFFDVKPDETIRRALKQRGFRWARSVGAWQRHNNESALYWAKQITGAGDAE